ncbi:O-antigen ligase family protein [Caproiciproducens sp. NJN-50]|uniref:O-antigen ligase family protein n=1 Tax=Acutalibacteraceae TaxID=3082771 RepID=UPI000FFE1332|nr:MULTISPECIES: O-antigen ligase family protein [Acutalibacteraceae]QAT50356.1 O-antigen ligase family protein [Caproiciproducens sp. NJN-50]
MKESIRFDFLRNVQLVYADFDRLLVILLTASIFAPFYVSMVVVIGIALMTMINCKKRVRAFEAPYTKFLFAFLIVTFFVAAIYNNYIGMAYSILIYAVVSCALYIRSIMTRSIFNEAMDLICVGSIISLFVALYQKASALSTIPDYRPVSVFINANYYGMIIEFVVIIALYRIFTNAELSAFYFAVIGLNFIGLYLTASFSSFTAMFAAVAVMLFLKKKNKIAVAFILSVVVFVGLLAVFPQLLPRGSQAIDRTLAQRLSIWTASVKGIEQHLFFGRGAMAYQMIYEQFSGYKTYHCHNLFLDVLLNFGIVGFACIGIYVGVQLKLLFLRVRNNICMDMNILMAAASAAVFVHGLTDVTILWIQTGVLFALIYSSTGIGSGYIEKSVHVPSLLPEYSGDSVAALYLKN